MVGHTENIIQATLWGLDRLCLGIHMHIHVHVHESEGEQGKVSEGFRGRKGGKYCNYIITSTFKKNLSQH